jgi:hypothetical protein
MEKHMVVVGNNGRGKQNYKAGSNPDRPQRDSESSNGFQPDAVRSQCPGCEQCQKFGGYVRRYGSWRPTKAHEYIFMLAKSDRYYADDGGAKEPLQGVATAKKWTSDKQGKTVGPMDRGGHSMWERNGEMWVANPDGRNIRTTWVFNTESLAEEHYAAYPKILPERCIKASTSEVGCCTKCLTPWMRKMDRVSLERYELPEDSPDYRPQRYESKYDEMKDGGNAWRYPSSRTVGWVPSCDCGVQERVPCRVLDVFIGSGTTGLVARRLGRDFIGMELNPKYADMAERRIFKDTGFDFGLPEVEVGDVTG